MREKIMNFFTYLIIKLRDKRIDVILKKLSESDKKVSRKSEDIIKGCYEDNPEFFEKYYDPYLKKQYKLREKLRKELVELKHG